MSYVLRAVALSDIEDLVRYCDHPAMQDNPLNLIMFPNSSPKTKEEEITWHVSSFRETFENIPEAHFRQVRTNDGSPAGLALWTLDQFNPHPCHPQSNREENKGRAVEIPGSLDICAWREISKRLALEKRRVLKGLTNVWRKSICTGLRDRG